MSLRQEFVQLASAEGANLRALCRRFGVSATTAYKWLARWRKEGRPGLADQSRRPRTSPARTEDAIERRVIEARQRHPAWGGRKLRHWLHRQGVAAPAPSTITAILRRHGLLPVEGASTGPWRRFERDAPNELWQMDFKGHFAHDQGRCHPLTVLDDHSRFALCLDAHGDERTGSVQRSLVGVFRRYGRPQAVLVDNGPPWGDGHEDPYTSLGVWLLLHGISVRHSSPYHPQTLGKDERFHRSLKAEVIGTRRFGDLAACQQVFDRWRDLYNLERPHEALGHQPPISRYRPSPASWPETPPPIEYAPGDKVRKVQQLGHVSFQGRSIRLPKAFRGYPVAFRPTLEDGRWNIYFAHQQIAQLDLRYPGAAVELSAGQGVNHVPEHS